jgi:hypothetical protein
VGRRRVNPGMLIAAGVGAMPAPAPAQPDEGGPVIVGERDERLRYFILDRISATLDFYARYQRDSIDEPGQPSREDTELLFRQSIGISSRFFLGHPNLADITADANLGLDNNFIENETLGLTNEQETSFFNEFNVNALILGEGPAPLTLFARRDESLLDRAFIGSVDSRTTEYGASVRTFMEIAPTTISYTHRVEELEDALSINDDRLTQDSFSVQSLWTPGDRHRFSLDYTLDLVDESRASGFDTNFTRHDATAIHEYRFGPDERHNLRSNLRLFDQSGDFEQTIIRLLETLNLRHTDNLTTRYDLTIENRDVRGQPQSLYRGQFVLRHELFESLVTTVNAGGSRFELDDENFTSDEFNAGLDFEYTKRVPYGRFDASLGLNGSVQEDSERGQETTILDAPRIFPDAIPITLTGANIIPASVVVRNLAGNRRFVEGIDYRQNNFPDRIELRRLVGGLIAENETVLVDYTLGPEAAATIDTFILALAARYTIEEGWLAGLSPYAQYRDVAQTISPSSPSRIPFDVRSFRGGVDYRAGRFTFNGEYERQDSSISPFDAWRGSARYDHRFGFNTFFRFDYTHETINFDETDGTIDLDRVLAEVGYRFDFGLELRLRALYRNERDSLVGDSEGFEQSLDLNWQIRQTSLFASLRNAMLESDNASTDSQTFIFGFSRRF